ncbi:MAG TPA: ATP-binding protein [bacterium]|nr:ATP-binding protein [bacterium]
MNKKLERIVNSSFINNLDASVTLPEYFQKEENIYKSLLRFPDSIKSGASRALNKIHLLVSLLENGISSDSDFDSLSLLFQDLAAEINLANGVEPNNWVIYSEIEFIEEADKYSEKISSPAYSNLRRFILSIQKNKDFIIAKQKKINEFIKIDSAIIDQLAAIITELSINKNKLLKLSEKSGLDDSLTEISGNISNIVNRINGSLSKITFMPLIQVFNRFPSIVGDLAAKLGKKIVFTINDNNVVIDKKIADTVGEVFIHLIKNSVDHGIEEPDIRKSKNKNETGNIEIRAQQTGNYVVIKMIDDGKGLDSEKILKKALEKKIIEESDAGKMSQEEIYALIFMPGFSTAEKVSDTSGRGVGMDAVKNNIEKIGGTLALKSESGKGTTVIIRIPFQIILTQLVFARLCKNGSLPAFTLDYIEDIIYYESGKSDNFEISENNKLFFNNKNDKIPIWQCLGHKYENLNEYKRAILFSNSSAKLAMPVYEIIEQTDAIVKNFAVRDLKNKMPDYFIGYTIFDDELTPVLEPDFSA